MLLLEQWKYYKALNQFQCLQEAGRQAQPAIAPYIVIWHFAT